MQEIKDPMDRELQKTTRILGAISGVALLCLTYVVASQFLSFDQPDPVLEDRARIQTVAELDTSHINSEEASELDESGSEEEITSIELEPGFYWVVLSTPDEERAIKLRDRLVSKKAPAGIYEMEIESKKYYRVMLTERFNDFSAADLGKTEIPMGHRNEAWVFKNTNLVAARI